MTTLHMSPEVVQSVREPAVSRVVTHPVLEPEVRAEHARIRTVCALAIGIPVVALVLAVLLIGWDLAVLGTVGISLTAFLFGLPFWLAAIDSAVDRATGVDH